MKICDLNFVSERDSTLSSNKMPFSGCLAPEVLKVNPVRQPLQKAWKMFSKVELLDEVLLADGNQSYVCEIIIWI